MGEGRIQMSAGQFLLRLTARSRNKGVERESMFVEKTIPGATRCFSFIDSVHIGLADVDRTYGVCSGSSGSSSMRSGEACDAIPPITHCESPSKVASTGFTIVLILAQPNCT